jgi:hypothetical protein
VKIFESTCESIIIVCLAVLIVTPEIAYSLVLRGRDWVGENYNLFKVNIRKTIKKGIKNL